MGVGRRRGGYRLQLLSSAAAEYDAWYETPLHAAIDRIEARALLDVAAPRAGERALDAGCGTGVYTTRLADIGLAVTGVDADPEILAWARAKVPEATFLEADLAALPFDDDWFDLTLAVAVLCFVADPDAAARELIRVTRPGGRIVVGELNRTSLWAARRRLKGLLGNKPWQQAHFFTPASLSGLLTRAGAGEVRTETAAYLQPGTPGWLIDRAETVERLGAHLGRFGATFVVARGEVG